MNGLGIEQIIDHRVALPGFRPGYVWIPEELGGVPEDAPERHLPRPNRADRRRAAKARHRG